MHRPLFRIVRTVLWVACASSPVSAQCLQFAPGFGCPGLVGDKVEASGPDVVYALAAFDDGSGPALYCAGEFTTSSHADVVNIARWDGASFAPLGGGLSFAPDAPVNGGGRALAVFDDGTGPALYVGGEFTYAGGVAASNVAKWNGAGFSALGAGTDGAVHALAVFDDGTGPALFATGDFTAAGGAPARNIAKWNGASWSPLGGLHGRGNALAVFDDGGGSALYVGGAFLTAGGTTVQRVARWDGSTWQALANGVDGEVRALAAFDDGSGTALYAGGLFTTASGTPAFRIARWSGSAWSAVGGGVNGNVFALTVHDDGSGRALYVGGAFTAVAGSSVAAREIAKWNGTTWSALGAGVGTDFLPSSFYDGVYALAAFGAGAAPELHASGVFAQSAATALNNVARFDGAQWRALGAGNGIPRDVWELAAYDGDLHAIGRFQAAGTIAAPGLARFDGVRWATVGTGVLGAFVSSLHVFDSGAGVVLLADAVRQWDGVTWSLFGAGSASFNNVVREQLVYDDGSGPKLYVGGDFSNDGMQHVARWNGSAWEPVGSGLNGRVHEMIAFDDGTGLALIVGGEFTHAGLTPASGVARWNGVQWSAMANGIGGFPVGALEVFDHGDGAQLYGAASVGLAGAVGRVARWNGTSWITVGETQQYGLVRDLVTFGNGTPDGVALYAGGLFSSIGGVAASNLARFDGDAWHAVGSGIDGYVNVLQVWNDGHDAAPDLFAAGDFAHAGGMISRSIAQWRGCAGPGEPFCFADGSVATACPCAPPDLVTVPSGSAFAGCASATNPHGASLAVTGATNPDTIELVASGVTPGGAGMFFKGDVELAGGLAIADGVRCVGGAFVRFGLQASVSGVSRYPNASLGYTLPVSVVGSTPPGSGTTGHYQFVYRGAQPGFCGPGTLNLTNAYRLAW